MTEKFVASGLRWNYFYHTWKTISWSPYANAVVVMDNETANPAISAITVKVEAIEETGDHAMVITLVPVSATISGGTMAPPPCEFIQTEEMTEYGVGITKEGAILFDGTSKSSGGSPVSGGYTAITLKCDGVYYDSPEYLEMDADELYLFVDGEDTPAKPGDTLTFSKRV